MANQDPPEMVQPLPNPPQPTPPQQIIIQNGSRGSILWRIFAAIGWLGVMFCIPIILAQAISSASYYNTTETNPG